MRIRTKILKDFTDLQLPLFEAELNAVPAIQVVSVGHIVSEVGRSECSKVWYEVLLRVVYYPNCPQTEQNEEQESRSAWKPEKFWKLIRIPNESCKQQKGQRRLDYVELLREASGSRSNGQQMNGEKPFSLYNCAEVKVPLRHSRTINKISLLEVEDKKTVLWLAEKVMEDVLL